MMLLVVNTSVIGLVSSWCLMMLLVVNTSVIGLLCKLVPDDVTCC